MVLNIGDTSADGTLEIVNKEWDGNGTMFVTVRKKMDFSEIVNNKLSSKLIQRMRVLARKAISHPDGIRSSRVHDSWDDGETAYVVFAVSRLPGE